MKRYGLGMIGYGGMARHHFQNIAKDDRMDVIGVYDIDKKRNEVAKEDGLAVYASPEELLADEKIDIVLVQRRIIFIGTILLSHESWQTCNQ